YPRHSPPLTVMARPHPRATLFPYTTLFRSSSQTADICVGSTVDLSLQNMTLGSGVSYQWYASTDGGANWVPMGPNAATWSPTITDRKSTRLNSSHVKISYAVFCLKKKTVTT